MWHHMGEASCAEHAHLDTEENHSKRMSDGFVSLTWPCRHRGADIIICFTKLLVRGYPLNHA